MDQEQVFNYQLIIQKLEEECSLYRNGTTGIELLELINEKDIEIKSLTNDVLNKNEIIQKLAKSSQDVLEKSQILQDDKIILISERNILKKHVEQSLQQNLDEMSTELTDRFDDISKLQTRCAKLVAEKSEKSKALDIEIHTNKKKFSKLDESMKETKKKLDINENNLIIQQINNEKIIQENKNLNKQYNEYQVMTQDKYEIINKQYTSLNNLYTSSEIELKSTTSELKHTIKGLNELTIQKAELSHTLSVITTNKDLQINEVWCVCMCVFGCCVCLY